MNSLRIGHGYDVHRLVAGRRLILGGVEIPFEYGLDGHSDADVVAHAVIDALLGAAALGDIGTHFPDSDGRFKDADSMLLLAQAGERLRQSGYAVCNIDCTIIAQRPKLAGYTQDMCVRVARRLGLEAGQVSVKATTEEGLGFTGAGQGIAAHAVCIINKV